MDMNSKILVVIAHPDDEVLGMGGTIAKRISHGYEVTVCVFTNSYEPYWSDAYREEVLKEQKAVDEVLGVKRRIHLNFPTCELSGEKKMVLHKAFREVVREVQPRRIYTTAIEDFHADHQEVFKTALVNSRPIGGEKIEMISFETPSSTEWGYTPFQPNMWVDLWDTFLETKMKALSLYKSEGKTGNHPRSLESVERLARLRGEQIGVHAAEAFRVVRIFE